MRFRPWLSLAATPLVAVALFVGPAAAENFDQTDQLGTIRGLQLQMREIPDSPRSWVEAGATFPIGTLEERDWDPGFLVRFNHEFYADDPVSLVGSLGLLFNDDSRFNEAEVDGSFGAGFNSFEPIDSHHHTLIPFAIMMQLNPWREAGVAPVFGIGPSVQWTQEKLVRREWVQISVPAEDNVFVVPIPDPGQPVPVATQSLNKTHFHLGFQGTAGIRARVGEGDRPLQMRLIGSANVWYEHDRPITLIGAALSFGK